jgi:aldose sugar dehydrogenase
MHVPRIALLSLGISAFVLFSCGRADVVQQQQASGSSQPSVEEHEDVSLPILPVPPEFSIPAFSSMRLSGTDFVLEEVLEQNDAYTRHAISYRSNGLRISGIMNIPGGEGPFPLIVLNHGYIDPTAYTSGRGLRREQDHLARKGFAVLHPDYRGHAFSDPSPNPHIFDAALEYSIDVANAILAVRNAGLESVDTERVGMLGHSLGGGIALNFAVSHPDLVDAIILYAPVNSDAWMNFTRWENKRDGEDQTRAVHGTPGEQPDFWRDISSGNFLQNIIAPLLIFHGSKDDDVPKAWSDDLVLRLQELGKDVTYVEYDGEEHEFINRFSDFMEQASAFFERGLGAGDAGSEAVQIVAEHLNIPWAIAFLPTGDMLVTERTGMLLRLASGERKNIPVEGVRHIGEGGLLGMALHPDFAQNQWLYLYRTSATDGGVANRIERYRFIDDELTEKTVILSGIPGAKYHDGGFLGFGPDGLLYITTGDAGVPSLAQDIHSLAGKILRIHDDGSVPEENPFGNAVYSYGHRNSQGLTWDNEGRLWSTEHGRSGLLSGLDELNLIKKGGNYGWPEIQGGESKVGMVNPVLHSGPNTTWAPASAAFLNGSIFFGGLRGESLYEAMLPVADQSVKLKAYFVGEFGRIRAAVRGPDGMLYLSTSNTDGRGRPAPGDDRILRVDPERIQ